MALPVNRLGTFNFFSIEAVGEAGGVPFGLQEDVEIVQRPGVDGTLFLLGGLKGEPFEIRTVVDVDTYAAGLALANQYRQANTLGKLVLIYNDYDFESNDGVDHVVQKVREPIIVKKLTAASGGLSTSRQAIVIATWILVPVEL